MGKGLRKVLAGIMRRHCTLHSGGELLIAGCGLGHDDGTTLGAGQAGSRRDG